MVYSPQVRRSVYCLAGLVIVLLPLSAAQGAPVCGEEFAVTQPDGTPLQVRIWGDEFYQVVESLDGYTLIRDPGDNFICYAQLSTDHSVLISTGTAVGQADPASLGLTPHLRVSTAAATKQAKLARQQMAKQESAQLNAAAAYQAPAPLPVGVIQGIVLLVDFSDDPGTIDPTGISNFCNQAGYSDYSNNGSVRDYFYSVSGGALTYTNYVPAVYYRAAQLKSYYDNPLEAAGPKARVLILEALNDMKSNGFDFSPYDANHDGYIDAINCFYAGTCGSPWAKGLWPHSSVVTGFSDDGVASYRYQITNIGSSLTLRTFCHENGHMVMNWPDLYDYGYESRGVGNFCLMCYGGSNTNPVQPCAYLRAMAGWVTPTLLTTNQTGLSVSAATKNVFKYVNPSLATEYYLIENRQQSGRDAALPANGLAIWHVDENGSNDYEQRTASQHYECTLVQADNLWHLESNVNYGDANDLWKAPTYTTCGPATTPNTAWWSGSASNLLVSGISTSGATMTFDFSAGGGGTPAAMTSPANGSTLSGSSQTFQWTAGTNVTQYRLWVGTVAGSTNLYNKSTGTTQQATVTGLPTDGSTVYVRLNSYIGSGWEYNDYTYTAASAGGTPATMTTPANGTTFTGTSQTFQWSAGTNVTQYRLWVGTTLGGSDISNQNTGTTQTATVSSLPTDGSTVYVRLGSYINSAWQSNDYTYTAVTINGTPAAMTSPANGATLASASQAFQWNAGTNVAQYRLWVGTTAGGKDLYNQSTGLTQQATVTGLPTDGSTIYVRLNSYIGSSWEYNSYTYTAASASGTPATMTSPANGTTFTGTSQTFQWSAGTNVTQYRLWVGTTLGGSDISNQNTGTTQTAAVSSLPTDGSTVYVRLGSYINNAWQSNDYTYTAVTINGTPAAMTSPANGSTLGGTSQVFQWNAGTNVAQYRLWVGTSAGGKDLYNESTGLTQQVTVAGLPSNGSTIYVRLNSYISGLWQYNDYSYTAASASGTPATMTSPVNGTTFTGASQTFQWSAGTNVTQYRLWIGTTVGGSDISNQNTGTAQTATVSSLPTDGSAVYVRLGSYINNAWQSNDYTYTAVTINGTPAAMTSPANGSTLGGTSQVFQWNAGTNVAQYRLWVGTTAGGKDLYNQSTSLTQQATVTGLPSNGSTIYIRLNSYINGAWLYNDYTYTAASPSGTPAAMTSPVNGTTFTGASQTFQWSAGTNVTQYRLWVGTTLGGSNVSNQNTGTTQTATVSSLPTDGSTVYVRLGSYINNAWQSNDYTYTAVTINGTPAAMTSPANGSTLGGTSQVFQWNTGTNVTQYRLWVGTTVGGKDLYNQSTGLTQQATVTGLPSNGSTIYVRLNSYINGAWLYNDYSYTAMTPAIVPATITSPVNGATLAGASQAFQWNAGTSVAQYRLWVGTTAGGKDLYNESTGLTQQATVTGLPTDGSVIYVRLNSYINGVWQYTESQYSAASSAAAPPPSIASAVSRRVHGLAGGFELDVLSPAAIECRSESPTLIVVTFDAPVMSTSAVPAESIALTCSTGVAPAVTSVAVADRVVTVELAAVPNRSRLTISFPGIVSAVPPSVAVSESVCFGILAGDVNGDGSVNMSDLTAARDALNQTTTSANYRADLNADGKINLFDLLLVRAGLNQIIDSTCP